MTIQLYCFGESGNSYKAALALELFGLDWESIQVDLFGGETRSDACLREINEMSEAPALVEGDFQTSQSGAIQAYVTEKSGKFGGRNNTHNYGIFRWVLWDNHKLSSQAGMTRFLMNFMPKDKRPAEVIAVTQGRLAAAYDVLNKHLEGRDWIVGDQITNADISCCSYLLYSEPFGFVRTDWPSIDRWLTHIEAVSGWKNPYNLMPGKSRGSCLR